VSTDVNAVVWEVTVVHIGGLDALAQLKGIGEARTCDVVVEGFVDLLLFELGRDEVVLRRRRMKPKESSSGIGYPT
jgi:hypothetical protein